MEERQVELSGYGAQESGEIFLNGFLLVESARLTPNKPRKQLDFGDFEDNNRESAGRAFTVSIETWSRTRDHRSHKAHFEAPVKR